ncbi:MAG TPA: hypothetical protein VJ506_04600 [Candidatus Limnocylindrales bacterium]|nr:hypothetical protein [Candidatus Limnocylindrales bacterium]
MYGLYASIWPEAFRDGIDERAMDHRRAIHEARIASQPSGPAARHGMTSLTDRVRLALQLSPAQTDCVTCPA